MNRQSSDKLKIMRERLQQAREQAGLSQKEAARLLKKPQWFVSRSETGTRRIDVAELAEFGRVYNKSLDFFLKDLFD